MLYTVVCAQSRDGIEDMVKAKIVEGWEPLGGICVCQDIDDGKGPKRYFLFSQAMTHY